MVTVCAWCQRYLGSREPIDCPDLTHGICDDCRQTEQLRDGGVLLVVSRRRGGHAGRLRSMLRGAPASAIVVDRRIGERRQRVDPSRARDRRAGDRRCTSCLYVV